MAQDIRVIIVKLADRLHNMRTLEHLPPEKRVLIALETREIFAPLANRLGIGQIKWALEDLSFKYLEPEAYKEIKTLIADKRIDREERINSAIQRIQSRLRHAKINPVEVSGRPKHLYSIYRKMQTQNKQFNEIYDVAAVRIITENTEECYRALAIVHDLFRPVPGRFKDYIGLPKPNHYQSLHTTVIGLSGRPMEVQIRTQEMHYVAEYGIAAHWKYKESAGSTPSFNSADEKFSWLRQLVDWQTDFKDDREYLENIKNNLFDEDVYVFTPQGDVVALPRSATPVDFAYRIHTEVGNHCAGARVNGRIVPLSTRLQNGDIVDIITQKNSHPSLDWLNFVRTSAAKYRIKQWYKRSRREENITRGKELLEKELGKTGFDHLLKSNPMQTIAEKCNYHNVEDLLAGLGYGEITLNLVLNRWRDIIKSQQPVADIIPFLPKDLSPKTSKDSFPTTSKSTDSPILGVEGLVYHVAGCCTPIPGEAIIGVVTRGRGISIHRQSCHNLEQVECERLVPVQWNTAMEHHHRPQTYPVAIQIETLDRVGILKDVLSRLTDQGINVRHADVKTTSGQPALMKFGIEVRDRNQLEHLFVQIKKMSDILNIRRVGEMESSPT